MSALRRNVAGQNLPFELISPSTITGLIGAVVVAYVQQDNGAQAAASGVVTEKGNGQYSYAPTQAETNATVVGFLFTAPGGVPVHLTCFTTAWDPTNAVSGGLSNLDATVSSRLAAGAYVAPDNADIALIKAKTDNLPPDPADESQVEAAIAASQAAVVDFTLGMAQLLGRADAGIAVDRAADLAQLNANEGSGAGSYVNTTDAQQAIRDRGDVAWITATAASLNLPEGLKKNQAFNAFEFEMVLSVDHVTPATGLVVAATRSIDGAAYGSCVNGVTEVGNGTYKINLAAADLNGELITFAFNGGLTADVRKVTVKTSA